MQSDEYGKMRAAEDTYWWFVARRRLALSLVKRFAPGGGRILDVGCGTGAVLNELAEVGATAGVDVSPLALGFASERGLKNLVLGDAQRLPFRPGSFDTVVSLDTVEHVPDDVAAVKGVFDALKPGGVFVMNLPAFAWLWGPHDVALMHCRRYTARQVRRLLVDAGFQVEFLSYSVFFLFPAVVLTRCVERFRRGPAKVRLPAVNGPVNAALVALMEFESRVMSAVPLPWGSSVCVVARKPAARDTIGR